MSITALILTLSLLLSVASLVAALVFKPERSHTKWHAGRKITLRQLAEYEGGLKGLHRVTALLQRIEDPAEDPLLRMAVRKNLGQGIPYVFIVSSDHFDREQYGYYEVFRNYAKEALQAQGTSDRDELEAKIQRLVRIVPLSYNWTEYPYVFYHCVIGRTSFALAFRGNKEGQGLTEGYVSVGREDAASIYSAILRGIDERYIGLVRDDLAEVTPEVFRAAPARPIRLVPRQSQQEERQTIN